MGGGTKTRPPPISSYGIPHRALLGFPSELPERRLSQTRVYSYTRNDETRGHILGVMEELAEL